jgi:carboxypeptidase D
VPLLHYVEAYDNIFRFNDTYKATLRRKAKICGYDEYLPKYLKYPPPKGPFPQPSRSPECSSMWSEVKAVASTINPCFNMYMITTTCPLLWDVLGFPGSFEYKALGSSIYFDRADVKKAINAPAKTTWAECKTLPLSYFDSSEPSSFKVLPRVIEKSERTIISHGTLDYILMTNGSLLSIQNMTWNGAQGFQTEPKDEFFVPYHQEYSLGTISGSGVQGIAHTERGLTWVEVFLSGHMVPQYTPTTAFRQLEFLLGRIPNISERSSFTVQTNIPQPKLKTKVTSANATRGVRNLV